MMMTNIFSGTSVPISASSLFVCPGNPPVRFQEVIAWIASHLHCRKLSFNCPHPFVLHPCQLPRKDAQLVIWNSTKRERMPMFIAVLTMHFNAVEALRLF